MKKLLITMFLLFSINVFAQENFEVPIKVKALNIETRLVFGSNSAATDSFDNQFDVPYFGGGSLTAYFEGDAGILFKDIRNVIDKTTWTFRVENKTNSDNIIVLWNPEKLPSNYSFLLLDTITNATIDMKTVSFYKIPNTVIRYLDIEVKKN